MPVQDEAVFRELTTSEPEALLARHRMGRLAYSAHDHVDIEPLTYVYDAPWIFGRTSVGSKPLALAHNRWCAFEIDEVSGLFDWQSVVVEIEGRSAGATVEVGADRARPRHTRDAA